MLLDLSFNFGAGVIAAFNPCGFAMLPVFIAFFMGNSEEEDVGVVRRIIRALKVSFVLSMGFALVFGLFGIVAGATGSAIKGNLPYVVMVLGVLFVPLGIAMVRGFEPKIRLPRMQKGGDSSEMASMFLFGVSYAVVSLSCTVGPLIAASSSALTAGSLVNSVIAFLAYGFGMGAVITTLTIGVALAQDSVAKNMRKLLPWVNRVSGVFLVLTGLYLVLYGYWEYRVLIVGDNFDNPLISFVGDIQGSIQIWIANAGNARVGIGMALVVAAVVLRSLWSHLDKQVRTIVLGGLVTAWALLEFVQPWGREGERANLLVQPTLGLITGFPQRIGNWFTDPLRWGVLLEIFLLGFIGLVLFAVAKSVARLVDPQVADAVAVEGVEEPVNA